MPCDFISRSSRIGLNIKGIHSNFEVLWKSPDGHNGVIIRSHSSSRHIFTVDKEVVIPISYPYGITQGSLIYAEIVDINRRASDLANKREETSEYLEATLSGFYSVESLIKAWPEAEPFCPKKNEKELLPVVQTKELNKLLGLP